MEQLKIVFFVISTFLGIENGQILATSTTVNISPDQKEVLIIQENLCSIIRDESSKTAIINEWNQIKTQQDSAITWATDLKDFNKKSLKIQRINDVFTTTMSLTYTNESQLRAMGIWFNEEKNEFSINEVPQFNISTDQGTLDGNYWRFNGEEFTFKMEPFTKAPIEVLQKKIPLAIIID